MADKRVPINITYEKLVGGGAEDVQDTDVIPTGEAWHISKVVFAHADSGFGFSGELELLFGDDASGYESIARAYMTGDTKEYYLDRDFEGNSKSLFRTRRNNLDPSNDAKMFVSIKGYKKIGG